MKQTKWPKVRIPVNAFTAAWNAAVEDADFVLGLAAVDVDDPRKLATLLSIGGCHVHRAILIITGSGLGYFDASEAQQAKEFLREHLQMIAPQ